MENKKVIRIPQGVSGFDEYITDYRNIIDTPIFQRLRWIMNCDLAFEVHVGLTNNRLEHSHGVAHEIREIIRGIEKEKSDYKFDTNEKATLEVAGLYHDIGHSPFSHSVEELLISRGQPNHDKKAVEKIEMMESEIKKVPDMNFSLLHDIFKRKSPMSEMIWSYVGADPLDYISRDAKHAGVDIASDSERIKSYAFYDGKKYGIETKATNQVESHINSWLTMYSDVYLRKLPTIFKGVLRTGFNELINNGKIKLEEVWEMTDVELLAEMWKSEGLARKSYYIIRNREPPKTFLSIKISGYESQEETRGKPIRVEGMPEKDIEKILEYFENTENIMNFERDVENSLGFNLGDITVAEMPNIKRLKRKDVNMYDKDRGWTTLFTKKPYCKTQIEERVSQMYALRITTRPELRKVAYEKTPEVLEMLKSVV